MIFIGYEPGSKGYQFWDTAHQCSKISHDVKFEETHFPVTELKLTQLVLAPLSDHQIPKSDNESDSLELDLVNLAQPPTGHLAQAYLGRDQLHKDPKVLDLQAHPFPHPGHHEVLTHFYQTQRLLHYSPQHLDTCSIQFKHKNNDGNKLDPLLGTSTTR